MSDIGYLGNPLLKKSNIPIEWSADLMKEYFKCSTDPIYFAEKYIKIVHVDRGLIPIKLYDYQKEIIDSIHTNRKVVCNTSRQAGKCVSIDTIVKIKIEENILNITMGELHEIFLQEKNSSINLTSPRQETIFSIADMESLRNEIRIYKNTSRNVARTGLEFAKENTKNNVEEKDHHSRTNRKFIKVFDVNNIKINTPTGWETVSKFNVTIPYAKVRVNFSNGHFLDCADNHILIGSNGEQIYAKDCFGKYIKSETEDVLVTKVFDYQIKETMYDLTVDSQEHVYYTNGILSHNTTTAVAIVLHYILFNEYKTVALLANKAASALEILNRIQIAYEALPSWLQQGVVVWNKGSMELENGCKVIASASSSSAIRGKSCVSGNTKVCIEEENQFFYIEIENIIDKGSFINIESKNIKYAIYRTVNKINNKEYHGFHKIKTQDDILENISNSGSIFKDGYMGSGKLIKRGLETHGPENFYQELISISDNREEAELVEKNIVNKEYVKKRDNYNIPISGNVCILFDETNGYYGWKKNENII